MTQTHSPESSTTYNALRAADRLPDVARPDAAVVLTSQWQVGTPERQRAAVDEAIAAWSRVPWPESLLSVSWLGSLDGATILTYSQWSSDEGATAFAKAHGPTFLRSVVEVVPGVELRPPVRYRLYRSGVRADPPATGCIVVVSLEFDGPDEARQRRWVDLVFDALAAEPSPHPGGIAAHFHLSVDGTRVFNYATWTSEEAHRDALERSGQGTIGSNARWLEVKSFPGVISGGFIRYRLIDSLTAGDALPTQRAADPAQSAGR